MSSFHCLGKILHGDTCDNSLRTGRICWYRQLKTGHRVLQRCNNWSSESVLALPSGSHSELFEESDLYEPADKQLGGKAIWNLEEDRLCQKLSVSTLHTNLCGAVSLNLRFYPRLRRGENQCWRHVNFAFEGGSYYVIFQNLPRFSRRLNPAASISFPHAFAGPSARTHRAIACTEEAKSERKVAECCRK